MRSLLVVAHWTSCCALGKTEISQLATRSVYILEQQVENNAVKNILRSL